MPRPDAHPFDGIADDLFEWMNGEVEYHVEAMRGGHRTPFSAATSEKDKLEYYRSQMYKVDPDGTVRYDQPNPEGRDMLLKTYGTQKYAEIMSIVTPKNGMRAIPAPEEPDPQDYAMPPMPEDTEPV